MDVTELVPGWIVARKIPADVIDGLHQGTYTLHGGTIRRTLGTDGGGRIVRHLIPARPNVDKIIPPLSRAGTTQQLLQMTTRTMLLSGLNLAVSSVGFVALDAKLAALDGSLKEIKDSVEGIASLLALEERAKLKATLKRLSWLMQHDRSLDTRDQQLLRVVLEVLGPVNEKYRELLPEATAETAMACQEYFALTSLATAICFAELGNTSMARRGLEDDYAFWAEQTRQIALRDLLGKHPERFVAGEFVHEVPLSEVAVWLNFARDESKSEQERIDQLRERVHLTYQEGRESGSRFRIPWPHDRGDAAALKENIEADKRERIPALRGLVARNDVFRGYVDRYVLLDENGITPSELQRKVDALDRKDVVDGYVILQPSQAEQGE